ncbi:MAG TPA: response regulator transcription factor [Chloroflexi bacterium]|nr:response regulator transcription factor [Chloroflexota bacterium]
MTTIVLADDHQVVRKGIRALLEAEEDFRLVGEANDGLEAVQLVERLRPDVLVVDLMMPGLNGIEVTRQVCKRSPETKVVVLSMHANDDYVLEALRAGALGYVLKDASISELVEAIHEASIEHRFLSPVLAERVIDAYVRQTQESTLDRYETLTDREREVLHLAAEGLTNAEVAERLTISSRTVETHRGNMMRKLKLENQTELVRYAIRKGIITLETTSKTV